MANSRSHWRRTRLSTALLLTIFATGVANLYAQTPSSAQTSEWPGIVVSPLPPDSLPAFAGGVSGIACPSVGNCVAVGWNQSDYGDSGAILTETDRAWSGGPPPQLPSNSPTQQDAKLLAVTCTSVGNCVAVGQYTTEFGGFGWEGLIVPEVDGTWRPGIEVPLPNGTPTSDQSSLFGVDCAQPGDCTAVGYVYSSTAASGLIVTESDGTWSSTVQATPPSDAVANEYTSLWDVSCPSADDCTAVGLYTNSSGVQGWIDQESAGAWTSTAAQLPADDSPATMDDLKFYGALFGVSCPSVGNCVVGGQYWNAAGSQNLAETESAGTWLTGVYVPAPSDAASNPEAGFNSIACTSIQNCAAVGQYDNALGSQGMTVSESDGTWGAASISPLPPDALSRPDALLDTVACVSGVCTAVGDFSSSDALYYAMFVSTSVETPSQPQISDVSGLIGGFKAVLKAPVTNGGSTIRSYQYSLNDGKTWSASSRGAATTLIISKLHKNVSYRLEFRAVNRAGAGSRSRSLVARTK